MLLRNPLRLPPKKLRLHSLPKRKRYYRPFRLTQLKRLHLMSLLSPPHLLNQQIRLTPRRSASLRRELSRRAAHSSPTSSPRRSQKPPRRLRSHLIWWFRLPPAISREPSAAITRASILRYALSSRVSWRRQPECLPVCISQRYFNKRRFQRPAGYVRQGAIFWYEYAQKARGRIISF